MVGDGAVLKNTPTSVSKRDFFVRLLFSLAFIPVVTGMYFLSFDFFCVLCLCALGIIAKEIFSSKIAGKIFLRIVAFILCISGILSFIYCRKILGVNGYIFLICITSFTDIGAYCFGKTLKGPKLCPKISPNKTWAGLIGGVLSANVACYCLKAHSAINNEFLSKTSYDLVIVQFIIFASIIGDLLESSFKRRISVKDMGTLFPGHGGMLDRLDSLIFASIVFAMVNILSCGA
jgi:CDP-diglyceride synthetase